MAEELNGNLLYLITTNIKLIEQENLQKNMVFLIYFLKVAVVMMMPAEQETLLKQSKVFLEQKVVKQKRVKKLKLMLPKEKVINQQRKLLKK